MIQIFVFASSSAYGVGGTEGGWVDALKRELHTRAYQEGGEGEKYEVFNFAKSGAKIGFVHDTFKQQLTDYKRPTAKTIALVAIGENNTKAENEPTNFVSTPEEYEQELSSLLVDIKANVDKLICVGSAWVDEAKTNPKPNPLTGGKSYFTNERKALFKERREKLCEKLGIPLVELGVTPDEWKEKYLYKDGLHPNNAGYQLICGKVLGELEPLLR